MFNRKSIAAVAVAGLAVLGLSACDPNEVTGSAVPVSHVDTTFTAPTTQLPIAAPKPADPMTADGMWRVPAQIQPGDYQIEFTDPSDDSAYYELCADLKCDIDMDGSDATGMISNDFISSTPEYVSIPADAQFMRKRNITLIPVG